MQHKPLAVLMLRIAVASFLVLTAVFVYATLGGEEIGPHRADAPVARADEVESTPPFAMLATDVEGVVGVPATGNSLSRAEQGQTCRIRSAAGVSLEELRWRTIDAQGAPSDEWRAVPYRGGEWLLPLERLPVELREPMHAPHVLSRDAREVLLEPRAMLTLRAENSASALPVATESFAFARGTLGARVTRRLGEVVVLADPGAGIHFSFQLAGGFQAEAEWWPQAGARDEWLLSEALGTPLADADLEFLVDDRRMGDAWQIELLLEPLDLPAALEVSLANGRLRLTERIEFADPQFLGEGLYRISGVPIGRQYQLYAVAHDGNAVARSAFRFEGQFVALVPVAVPGFRAQLVDARSSLLLTDTAVRLDFKFGDDECRDGLCVWNGYTNARSDSEGSLEFASLQHVRLISDAAWPPPPRGRASVSVAGYHTAWIELLAPTAGPDTCDLGTIELRPLEPDLRVVDVSDEVAKVGDARLHFGGFGHARTVDVHVTVDTSGAWALFVEGEEDAETLRELKSSRRLALTQGGSGWRWLQRDGDLWREVPSSSLECWVYAGDERAGNGRMLLRWGELEVDFGRAPRGDGRAVRLNAPADGLLLSAGGRSGTPLPLTQGARIDL